MTTSVKTTTQQHVALAKTVAYGNSFDAIYVGTVGHITVILNGDTVQYQNVAAGLVHPISGDSITAATTADNMVVMSW